MSRKARRRPSWKADKKQNVFYVHILSEEDGTLLERVCLTGLAAKGFRMMIATYGKERASQITRQMLITEAERQP